MIIQKIFRIVLFRVKMGVLTYVVQVANLAITTKEDDIRHMFGYIGRIDEVQMYPRK